MNIRIFSLWMLASSAFATPWTIHLAPDGRSGNAGTVGAPLDSLQAAADLLKTEQAPANCDAVQILLKPGRYQQNKTVCFNDELLKGKALTIKNAGDGEVIISGGEAIPADLFTLLKDNDPKLHSKAQGQLMVADLSALPVGQQFKTLTDLKYIEIELQGEAYSQLAVDGALLTLARWPNRGYNHIETIPDVGPSTRFLKPGEKAMGYSRENPTGGRFTTVEQADWAKWDAEFKRTGDAIMQGYPHNDWFYQNENVGAMNQGEIQLLKHTRYGIIAKKTMIPRRVRIVNLLCELDEPGEWYFDRIDKKLYIWPVDELTADSSISLLGGPNMIELNALTNASIESLIFENGGDLAVDIAGGENNRIAGCTFRNFLDMAFRITEGHNNGIQSCNFYGLLKVGLITGGNRTTLEACNHYIDNCHIHHCRQRGYKMVDMLGCGIRFTNNLLHDTNGAVSFQGNDIEIGFNEFYNMGWEMGDWNVAYSGADWASFGNEIHDNFVHHLMELPGAYPLEGFRNDDGGMGIQFDRNIFYKSGRGAVAFSGAGNTCCNNIALETSHTWSAWLTVSSEEQVRAKWALAQKYDNGELRRGDKDDNLWRAEQIYGKMGFLFDPYLSRYPEAKAIMMTGNPWSPAYGKVLNNYTSLKDTRKAFSIRGDLKKDMPASCPWELPETITMDAFENPEELNFNFKKGFKPMEGFEPMQFDRAGLYADDFRPNPPAKSTYRTAIKKRFEGTRSAGGRYDMKTVNARYPAPAYLQKKGDDE